MLPQLFANLRLSWAYGLYYNYGPVSDLNRLLPIDDWIWCSTAQIA